MIRATLISASVLFVLSLMYVSPIAMASTATYVGSETCASCHRAQYDDWKTSGHPYKLRPASVAQHSSIPLPEGYTWDDVSYLIGGFRWKARFVDKKGYIITTNKQGKPIPTQWNIVTGRWVNYHPGEKKPYDCGPCHTTGYSQEGHQEGLNGIIGTWVFPGIHCEACHGPGSEHAGSGDKKKINLVSLHQSSALCGQCHIRGKALQIPAMKGFIRSQEQYNEYLASPHGGVLECLYCHDPHKPARFGIKKSCGSCHTRQEQDYKGSSMEKARVECIDCHMPRASMSAEAFSPVTGDVRTHNWKIVLDPDESMFTEDGKFAKGILTLDVVCLKCHGNRDVRWASSNAKGIHSKGKKK